MSHPVSSAKEGLDAAASPVAVVSTIDPAEAHKRERFATYAWILLIYNLAAVAWGVYVRASISGDGCGSHWPLCDGRVIPAFGTTKQIIEFSHRVSTGLILPLAGILVWWSRRVFAKGHQARTAAYFALGFTCLEALIGMALVKLGLVAQNSSAGRAGVMSFHVVSTFLLVSSIAIAGIAAMSPGRIVVRGQRAVATILGVAFASIMVLAVSGAVSALGHTLKPVDDVLKAAAQPGTFWMVRLQPLHPYLAVIVGMYLALVAGLITHLRPSSQVRRAAAVMLVAYSAEMALGLINIETKAPIGLQMLHLAAADGLFLSLIAMAAFALMDTTPQVQVECDVPPTERLRGKALIKAYIVLTKPRVISLLLFTTLTAMFAAAGGWPGGWLLVAVAIGGYMSAGAANAINMVIDRDIDRTMKRTATRPTVTQSIPAGHALMFGLALAIGSFAILCVAANLLCAALSLAGLVFYVVVYTLMLKRRTWQNIVIGGAAGAFPPLVGWAAVSGNLTPLAYYLFAIIFAWTPVHFWALALLIKDDYAKAGVPMLPVVRGERNTVVQIGMYAVLTVAVTLMPVYGRHVGWLYVVTAIVLNVILAIRCAQLYKNTDRPHAVGLYKFSMLYLAVLFLMLAVDQRWLYVVM